MFVIIVADLFLNKKALKSYQESEIGGLKRVPFSDQKPGGQEAEPVYTGASLLSTEPLG